jgi:hypothetical protein
MIAPAELYPSEVVPHEGVVFAPYQVDLPAPCSVVARDEPLTVLDQVAQGEVFTPFPEDLSFRLRPRRS